MTEPVFKPGFRFSMLDALVLLLGTVATVVVGRIDVWIGIALAFVVLHFFLFCNVLRMSRPLELFWAAAFSLLAVLASTSFVTWPVGLLLSLFVTLGVVAVEMRRPSYHGVGWKALNPDLPAWWRRYKAEHMSGQG